MNAIDKHQTTKYWSVSNRAWFGLVAKPILCGLLIGCSWTFSQQCSAQSEDDSYVPAQIAEIDRLIEEAWAADEIKPSRPASDGEWCRRVYLDILGRIPKVDELDEFVNDKSANKKARLVEELLHDDAYTEEFARNWTTIWTNLLIGRTGGIGNNSSINRTGMQKFLRDSFARNKPYDRMVYQLVTATGSVEPGAEDFNGAVNFLIDKVNEEDAAQATAATSKLFLGLQVQCTQCHNHPFNEWKQRKYWEMNAFFRQTRAGNAGRRAARMNQTASLFDRDYIGPSGMAEEAEIYYELRNGEMQVAYPVFVDGSPIDPDGRVKNTNRREQLGKLIQDSAYLEKAMVNRMWGHFLGYGFTKPVDDLGPHNPPSNPELLDYVSKQFREYDFDVRELITWIVLSRPYSLSSQMSKANQRDDPTLGEAPRFSHFYLRQMRAEELYESLVVATQAEKSAGSYEDQERRKSMWLQQFSTAFGTDEGDETTSFNGTIPQVLMMFNGDLIRNATATGKGSLINQIIESDSLRDREKINYLFKSGLSRAATSDEMNLARDLLAARNGDANAALQDLWWVILNSNEFIFNH